MAEWLHALEVEAIAETLIETVDRHADLSRARIEYVFIDKAPKSHGRQVWGRARKISGLAAFFAAARRPKVFKEPAPFFVVEISHDIWTQLDEHQRRALVDHELCHLYVDEDDDGELVLGTRGHDVEEFRSVIERNGLWSPMSQAFAKGLASHVTVSIAELEDHANTGGDDGGQN